MQDSNNRAGERETIENDRMPRLVKLLLILPLLAAASACGQVKKWYYCGYGHKSTQNREFESAISLLDNCLTLETLSTGQRALYLQTRAWAHFSLDNFQLALRDQENAFRLEAPATYAEFINHANYLRMAGKPLQSLEPLRQAESLDDERGEISMMTQYNLGWTLSELGRYEEAIAAFSRGIARHSDYPFAYFRRGLAYHRVGQSDKAESDFAEFVSFFEPGEVQFNERFGRELAEASRIYPDLGLLLAGPE